MGYLNNTVKHFKAYSPDLGRVHRSSRMKIDKGVRGGIIDLKLRGSTGPQGTPNVLPNRISVGRPREQDEKAPIVNQVLKPVVELPEFDPPADIPRYEEDENGDTYLVGK